MSTHHPGRWVDTHPADSREDRAILSFTLLLSVLLSAFVISLTEAPPHLAFASIQSNQN